MSKTFKEGIERGAEQVTQAIKETLPKVQFNKNGYEIRTQVLDMAKAYTEFSYSSKWLGFENTVERDPKTGQPNVGFAPFPIHAEQKTGATVALSKKNVVYSYVPAQDFVNNYNSIFGSGIVVPSTKTLITG